MVRAHGSYPWRHWFESSHRYQLPNIQYGCFSIQSKRNSRKLVARKRLSNKEDDFMAKEKFDRSKPHVNIGTIGHVDLSLIHI